MHTLIGFGRVVSYYHTLTASGDAIVAANHAAPPVYRQLDIIRLQSDAVMRGTPDRLNEKIRLSAKTSLRFSRGRAVALPRPNQFLLQHVP